MYENCKIKFSERDTIGWRVNINLDLRKRKHMSITRNVDNETPNNNTKAVKAKGKW